MCTGARTDYYDLPTKRRARGTAYIPPVKEDDEEDDGSSWPRS
jgi:hypothetical protein